MNLLGSLRFGIRESLEDRGSITELPFYSRFVSFAIKDRQGTVLKKFKKDHEYEANVRIPDFILDSNERIVSIDPDYFEKIRLGKIKQV